MALTGEKQICLEMLSIVKQFPKVLANNNINIKLYTGEILALLGENGAGKSTLMNILYGLYKPTSGEILLNGQAVTFASPRDAIRHGLGMVHQHFMLVETLTVTENIILGVEPGRGGFVDYKAAREEVRALSERYHLHVDLDEKIENLSVGLQQRVEILKALYRKAKILILDEPTAVLTPQEVDELFVVIRKLVETGVSIIIITHKLEEVKAISDRVYILRRGEITGVHRTAEATKAQLANYMVGRDVVLTVNKVPKEVTKPPVFTINNLTVIGDNKIPVVKNLSLAAAPGEIVGIAGVDGNGQAELAEAIRGLRRIESGSLLYKDKIINGDSTQFRIRKKMGYVPADRRRFGLVLPMTISENMALGHHLDKPNAGWFNLCRDYMQSNAKKLVTDFDIRTPGVGVPAEQLSGGNQQKVILAREFSWTPEFLLVSQPTRGLDVGAIEYIHTQILRMRDNDVAILLISLELEEIFSLSDRILIIYEGQIIKEFQAGGTNEKEVGFYMTGGKERSHE
ncbi:MAG: ABC transporter ATP-binding protein [Spirochaetales bacterium]|jgi:simple sugar transport system ATP-binding protein|nr:ABC transporter ATP-binding protein [Spirochaetales bacterium]